MAFRHPPDDDTPVAEQFGSYARSAGLVLIYGAIVALLLGFALGSLSVWNQYEQARRFDGDFYSWRLYTITFLQNFGGYALIASVLFAGGVLISTISWFHSALAEDFDELYEDSSGGGDDAQLPPANPSSESRPADAG
ncbi:MAG: hypothetical protein R3C29_05355 [Dehalococcoidia bacterium]